MNQMLPLVALLALPAVLGLLATPLVARLLAGTLRPGLWVVAVAGWAIISTLVFAAWYSHAVDQEMAAHVPGPLMQDGIFMIVGFVFWNGVLVAAVNLVAAIFVAVQRRRAR